MELLENDVRVQKRPVLLPVEPTNLEELPPPDFTSYYDFNSIKDYPLSLSRGCPYKCSFCSVMAYSGRRWRPRGVSTCLQELKWARQNMLKLRKVVIVDDCPTLDMNRFKRFLDEYLRSGIGLPIEVSNVRADRIDREIIRLLAQTGADTLCLGAEHGDSEVFNMINKGETQDQIRQAARMIKEAGLKLGLCFVIGLPGDSYEKTLKSVRMVHDLDADFVFWNMLIPYKGSAVRTWYDEHGRVSNLKDVTPNIGSNRLTCDTVVCSTEDFTIEERLEARTKAVLETGAYSFLEEGITPVLRQVATYGFWPEFFRSLIYKSRRLVRLGMRRLRRLSKP